MYYFAFYANVKSLTPGLGLGDDRNLRRGIAHWTTALSKIQFVGSDIKNPSHIRETRI